MANNTPRDKTLTELMLCYYRNAYDYNCNQPIVFGDGPSTDSFGRQRTSDPYTVFDSKQIFDNQPLLWDDQEVSGSGTNSSHSTDTASTTLSVNNLTAGKRVRQTFQRFNYEPGKSLLVFITGTLSTSGGGTGITRAAGLFDDDNGVFFQDNEGVVSAVIRTSTSGSAVDTKVAQTDWNLDKLDGTGPSGYTLDALKSQIIVIDIEWLGVGRVRVGFVVDGAIVYCHQFLHANRETGVYMSTPNLPLRYEIENDGTGASSSLETICSTIISEGGTEATGIVRTASTGGTHIDLAAENSIYALIGLRLKSGNVGATVKLLSTSLLLTTASDQIEWSVRFNPTVAGTFTYSGQTNSAVEVATGATANTVTGGTLLNAGFVVSTSGGGGSGLVSADLDSALRLGAAIDGTVDEIVLCARPIAGTTNADVEASLTWRELI